MGKLLDYYGEFQRRAVTCKACGWTGVGAQLKLGETFGHGAEHDCPACGEYHSFAQWSVVVDDDAPDDWKAKVPPIGD